MYTTYYANYEFDENVDTKKLFIFRSQHRAVHFLFNS